jgi:hypothetical protein
MFDQVRFDDTSDTNTLPLPFPRSSFLFPFSPLFITSTMPNTIAWFDITIGGEAAGRLEFELYDDVVPKTADNFKHLCIGDKVNAAGVKLAYAGSGFHRCIKG